MSKKKQDLLSPDSSPSNIKQGKELSRLAPLLVFGLIAVIAVVVIVTVMRRGPANQSANEDVEVVSVKGAPIGDDRGIGEIEPYKPDPTPEKEASIEANEIAKLNAEIEMLTSAKDRAETQKNIYWEKYKEEQLVAGKARKDNLIAAAQAESTVGGGKAQDASGTDQNVITTNLQLDLEHVG